jgi:REP element-mobilizing transposase RayT
MEQQLAIEFPVRRGGARPGAGRPRKKDEDRGFIAHRRRASHRKDDPVHVTLRVMKRVPSLRRQVLAKIIERALLAQQKKLRDEGKTHFQLVDFSIQADHLHLIVEASDKRGLSRGLIGLEVRIARRINKVLGRKGRFWSERYHRHDLRTPTETRNALRYVLLNIKKHAHFSDGDPVADPYSSGATFDGFARPPALVDTALHWPRVTHLAPSRRLAQARTHRSRGRTVVAPAAREGLSSPNHWRARMQKAKSRAASGRIARDASAPRTSEVGSSFAGPLYFLLPGPRACCARVREATPH